MKLDTEKLGVKTFVVTYNDNSRVVVKPVSWKKLDDIQILQYQILEATAACGGSPGDLLNPSNTDFWEPARTLASLLPVVGKEELGIDLDKIDDCEELIEIFVTTTKYRDPESGFITPSLDAVNLEPSRISRINGVNFIRLLVMLTRVMEEKLKTEQTATS